MRITAPSSSSRAGTSPFAIAARARKRVARPWARMSAAPTTAVSTTSPMVATAPTTEPTSMSTQISAIGTTRNRTSSRRTADIRDGEGISFDHQSIGGGSCDERANDSGPQGAGDWIDRDEHADLWILARLNTGLNPSSIRACATRARGHAGRRRPCALGAGGATDAPAVAKPPAAEARAGSAPLAAIDAATRVLPADRAPALSGLRSESVPGGLRSGAESAEGAADPTAGFLQELIDAGRDEPEFLHPDMPRSGWRRRRGTRVSPSSGGASSPTTTSTPSGWRCISRRVPPRGLRLPGSTSRRARPRRIPTSAGSRSTVSRQWHRCGSPTRALPPRPLPWTWSTRAAPTRGSATRRSARWSRCGSTEPAPVRPREGRPPRLASPPPLSPTSPPSRSPPAGAALSETDRIAWRLATGGLGASAAAFFGFGVLLSLTPCIFPMIPILSSILVAGGAGGAGRTTGGKDGRGRRGRPSRPEEGPRPLARLRLGERARVGGDRRRRRAARGQRADRASESLGHRGGERGVRRARPFHVRSLLLRASLRVDDPRHRLDEPGRPQRGLRRRGRDGRGLGPRRRALRRRADGGRGPLHRAGRRRGAGQPRPRRDGLRHGGAAPRARGVVLAAPAPGGPVDGHPPAGGRGRASRGGRLPPRAGSAVRGRARRVGGRRRVGLRRPRVGGLEAAPARGALRGGGGSARRGGVRRGPGGGRVDRGPRSPSPPRRASVADGSGGGAGRARVHRDQGA